MTFCGVLGYWIWVLSNEKKKVQNDSKARLAGLGPIFLAYESIKAFVIKSTEFRFNLSLYLGLLKPPSSLGDKW